MEITSSNKINSSNRISVTGILTKLFLIFLLFYFFTIPISFAYNNLPSCGTDHRKSCYDIIDLPLCTDVKSPNPASPSNQSGNCVKECKDMGTSISSQPNEGHNYSCIRFCDPANATYTESKGNCIARGCHQLQSGQYPTTNSNGTYTNCTMLDCHLLSKDELNTVKFNDDSKKYCNGDNIKCYEFGKDKLPYVKFRLNNTMCKIHSCKPDSDSCGADDTKNITNRCDSPYKTKFVGTNACQSGESSSSYSDDYIKYINAKMSLDSGLCQPVSCKPIANRQYRCTPENDSNPTIKDPNCTTSCSNGFCSKVIDCNNSSNSKETECLEGEPQTIDKMVDTTNAWFYRPKPSDTLPLNDKGKMDKNINKQDICYTTGQMQDNDWGTETYIFGWWHGFVARSPGHCSASRAGLRGLGYANLCGTGGNVYNKPDEDAAYISGYATANYDLDDPEYGVRACLRFKNSGALNACGSRECRIDCGFSFCGVQWCGSDICVDLTLNESDVDKCSLKKNPDLFKNASGDSSCIETIDNGWGSGFGIGRMRVRAKKYGRRMCTFLDMAGTFAYDAQYLDGTETLDDGSTCIEGENGTDGKCNGFDTNSDRGLAHRWRTIKIPNSTVISYIAQPGYYNLDNQFFPAQQCAMVPLRIGPPRYYNIATPSNSVTLFAPPVYILNSKVRRGQEISTIEAGEQYGETDFFEPEIEVKFGGELINTNGMQEPVDYDKTTKKSSQLLSLGVNEFDYNEKNYDKTSPSYAVLKTKVFGVIYTAEIFVKKDYDENKKIGMFCLYRRFTTGKDSTEIQIGCVKRKTPEIYAIVSGTLQKALINPDVNNTYSSAALALKLMANPGVNKKDDNCQSDDTCSPQIELEQKNLDNVECSYDIEKYKFCVKREECSKLYMECVQNEIDLHNAKLLNKPTGNLENIKTECNTTILNNCNKKWGITSTKARSIFEQTFPDPKTTIYYGWYNEICITTGFDKKLRKILSSKIDNDPSIMGKCVIDVSESLKRNPNLSINDITTQCAGGGRAPKCICQESTGIVADNQIERLETPREAGLCIDIPKPVACLPINWTDSEYSPKNDLDPFHVSDSIGKNSYGVGIVDYSHQFRTLKKFPNQTEEKSHAEFDLAVMGMTNVEGTCNGFWKPITNSMGVALKPKMDCLAPSTPASTTGKWDYTNIKNECIRYQCSSVTTSGIESSGEYQNGYGSNEVGEQKGSYHGFALWPSYLKTNDFVEKVTATQCIVGFKPRGGSLPNRDCNQLGSWGTPANVCERIYCPAINMMSDGTTPISTRPTTPAEQAQWTNSGGASFPSVAASRSKDSIRPESVSIGICNNNIGVFQPPGGDPPKRECDYQGNWGPVKNPCVSTCDAINDAQGRNTNNGFSMWAEVKVVVGEVSKPGKFLGCVSGYVVNPYKPLPTKECQSTITVFGIQANVWYPTQNGCIDGCQGYAEDPTEGVGLTTLPSSKGQLQIKWSKTALGGDAYYQSPDSGCSILDASKFQPGRTNGCYRLKRHCNIDGRWDAPIPMCMANNGKIGFATYPGNSNFMVNGSTVTGTCIDGYKPNGSSAPIRQCTYKSGNTNIDEVSFSLTSGTSDCIEVTCTASAAKTVTPNKVCIFSGMCFQPPSYQEPTFKSPDSTATYNGTTDKTVKVGEKIYLSCTNGYGYKIIGGSRPSSDTSNTCGLSTTDRDTSSPPYASCKSDGSFEFGNPCQKCRDCNASSYVPSNRVHADKACVTETWSMPHVMDGNGCNKNTSHGQQKNFGVYYEDYCAGNCEDGNKGICMVGTLQCLDGRYNFIADVSHQDGCDGSDNQCWACFDDDDCGDW